MLSLGIDLSASEKRKSAYCLLKNKKIQLIDFFNSNKEILKIAKNFNPDVIAIDSPLSKPKKGEKLRNTEAKLRKLKIYAYPPLIPSMKKLTLRGIKLRKIFERNFKVIEVFPSAVWQMQPLKQKLKNLKRKEKAKKILYAIFNKEFKINQHSLDAIIAAWLGILFLKNKFQKIGKRNFLVLPSQKTINMLALKL